MWPRTAEEFARGFNSGFVSFTHRPDAEIAFQALHQTHIGGRCVRISWGRAVLRAPHPLPLPRGLRLRRPPPPPYAPDPDVLRGNPDLPLVIVQPPLDLRRRRDIDCLARDAVSRGVGADTTERDADVQKRFRLLFDPREHDSDDMVYYRWRLHSLSNGDTEMRWRTAPYALEDGGPLWSPPSCSRPINNPPREAAAEEFRENAEEIEILIDDVREEVEDTVVRKRDDGQADQGDKVATQDEEDDSTSPAALRLLESSVTRLDLQLLTDDASDLGDVLSNLCTRRSSIARAMVLCIDQARCAGDVSCRILLPVARGTSPSPLPALYLAHDVLCNVECGQGGAAAFRQRMELVLPVALRGMGRWLRTGGAGGLIGETRTRAAVSAVLDVWVARRVFSRDFVDGLRALLPAAGGVDV
jgi:U2-associated protein SR140